LKRKKRSARPGGKSRKRKLSASRGSKRKVGKTVRRGKIRSGKGKLRIRKNQSRRRGKARRRRTTSIDAYNSGFNQSYNNGYNAGFTKGFEDGHQIAYEQQV
jgi:hypothetical protein